jgi:hypothetical protein
MKSAVYHADKSGLQGKTLIVEESSDHLVVCNYGKPDFEAQLSSDVFGQFDDLNLTPWAYGWHRLSREDLTFYPEAQMPTLKERVYASCDRAVENGYVEDFDGSGQSIYDVNPDRLAADALDCDADLENESFAPVSQYCREWQNDRRPK